MPVYLPAFAGTKLYRLVTEAVRCEQLSYKVVAQQHRGRALNPRPLDRKSDTLPLCHRATLVTRQALALSILSRKTVRI